MMGDSKTEDQPREAKPGAADTAPTTALTAGLPELRFSGTTGQSNEAGEEQAVVLLEAPEA